MKNNKDRFYKKDGLLLGYYSIVQYNVLQSLLLLSYSRAFIITRVKYIHTPILHVLILILKYEEEQNR